MYAWKQVPAASLPNDAKVWARVTGRSLRQIQRLVADGGNGSPLHGWVRCSDGRLYHPVLAADALRAASKSELAQGAAHMRWTKAREFGQEKTGTFKRAKALNLLR